MKFGADRGGCSFEIKLDDSRWIQANSPLRFKQPLADGNHTFLVTPSLPPPPAGLS